MLAREELDLVDVRELVKAGVHFGHRTSRWNPRMAPYILKKRNLIHIIDLRETLRGLVTARHLVRAVAARGKCTLFVGTKRQARDIVQSEAQRCGMPYVCERWPGGLLTNYGTIRKRLDRLLELEELDRTGEINLYSKKMVSSLRREMRKINRNLGGVRQMNELPGAIAIIDPKREHLAVKEGVKLRIPTIGWTDTDGDPNALDVCVPANDDALGAIRLFMRVMSDAALEAREVAEGASTKVRAEPAKSTGEQPAAPEAPDSAVVTSAPEGGPQA